MMKKSLNNSSLRGPTAVVPVAILHLFIFSVVLMLPISASAATTAGVKPGSFWYFFDTASEKIALFFTFNPENKAKKALEYADERLAEIEAIADEKNPGAVKVAITNYEDNVALATEKSREVKDKGQAENLLTAIEEKASKNQEVLSAVLIKVPEEAKAAIAQAIEASKKGQEEAAKQIADLKGEVEKLKQEVAELKAKDEERKKIIEELSKRKSEATPAPIKQSNAQTLEVLTSKPATPTAQTPAKTTSVTTLPSGAVVEMDANGDVVRYIKEAPMLSQATLSAPVFAPDTRPVVDATPPLITADSSANIKSTFPDCAKNLTGSLSCLYFETSKPTTAKVSYFPTNAVPYYDNTEDSIKAIKAYAPNAATWTDNNLSTTHTFNYKDLLSPNTKYYVSIQVTDEAGNISKPFFSCDANSLCDWSIGCKIYGSWHSTPTIALDTYGIVVTRETVLQGHFQVVAMIKFDGGDDPFNRAGARSISYRLVSDDFPVSEVKLRIVSGSTIIENDSLSGSSVIIQGYGSPVIIQAQLPSWRTGKFRVSIDDFVFVRNKSGELVRPLGLPLVTPEMTF